MSRAKKRNWHLKIGGGRLLLTYWGGKKREKLEEERKGQKGKRGFQLPGVKRASEWIADGDILWINDRSQTQP